MRTSALGSLFCAQLKTIKDDRLPTFVKGEAATKIDLIFVTSVLAKDNAG